MKKRILLLPFVILAVLIAYKPAKAQRQTGQAVRLRIQQVTKEGVLPRTVQGEPEVVGFSCASNLADSEPTCYVLLRDRVL